MPLASANMRAGAQMCKGAEKFVFERANLQVSQNDVLGVRCRAQGAVVKRQNFSAVQEHCPPEKLSSHQSLLTI
jgi:hypothetical protein